MTQEQQRKILEAAAKACGISVKPMEIKNVTQQGDDRFIGLLSEDWPRGWFNPLTNSADCAAMCAKLEINTFWWSQTKEVECVGMQDDADYMNKYHDGTDMDKEAAWRYAATMVATMKRVEGQPLELKIVPLYAAEEEK